MRRANLIGSLSTRQRNRTLVKTTSRRYGIDTEMLARIRAEQDLQPVLTLCAFCDDFCEGTLAEGRAWHQEHRAEHGVQPAGRRPTPRSFINGTSLEDNIAATRLQGGHHWEDAA